MNLFSYTSLGDIMLKKTIKVLSILLLSVFSFYYTNKSVELIREQDPIMKEIRNTSEKYSTSAENAVIKNNTLIPGLVGEEIDYEKTYNKMKQYGSYNEVLTTLKEIEPSVSVEDYYDKFIISGNPSKKSVALVFKVTHKSPKEFVSILNNNKIPATFFIDGKYIENNYQEISTMTNFELELLSYNSQYEEFNFLSSKDYLETITSKEMKYCYSEYDQEEVIKLCQKLNMHTIVPTIQVNTSPYQEIKEKLTNSAIISIPLSELAKNELATTIKYIKSRGYTLMTLEELLSENIEK